MAASDWIFLRGMSRGQGHWGDFVERFQSANPTAKVELLDLPGNGFRYQDTSPLKISDYVDDMRMHSKLLKSSGSVNMVALSLGGMIAANWMQRFPADLAKVVLINTSAGNVSSVSERMLISNYAKIILSATEKDPLLREEIILNMVVNNKQRLRSVLPQMASHSVACPFSPNNFARQLWAAARASFPEQCPGEVFVVGSEGDRLVSVNCSKQIAKMWKLEPILHPWAGHDLPVDDPQWLIDLLAKI